jgi:hypothetical protein
VEKGRLGWVTLTKNHPNKGRIETVTRIYRKDGNPIVYTLACYLSEKDGFVLALLVQRSMSETNQHELKPIQDIYVLVGSPLLIKDVGVNAENNEKRAAEIIAAIDQTNPPLALFRTKLDELKEISQSTGIPEPATHKSGTERSK